MAPTQTDSRPVDTQITKKERVSHGNNLLFLTYQKLIR